jgi:hypothetical protein
MGTNSSSKSIIIVSAKHCPEDQQNTASNAHCHGLGDRSTCTAVLVARPTFCGGFYVPKPWPALVSYGHADRDILLLTCIISQKAI